MKLILTHFIDKIGVSLEELRTIAAVIMILLWGINITLQIIILYHLGVL